MFGSFSRPLRVPRRFAGYSLFELERLRGLLNAEAEAERLENTQRAEQKRLSETERLTRKGKSLEESYAQKRS